MSEFPKSYNLAGKNALVTGSARGIGREIAEKLAEAGAGIVISDVNDEEAKNTSDEIAKKYGVKSGAYKLNVADAASVDEAAGKIIADFKKIDILVNNAGITRDTLMIRMKPEDFELVIKINLTGAFLCIKAFGREMMKLRYGKIVNIASVIGLMGNPGQANYGASKAGLIALTKTAAKEFSTRGIRVNAVAPGYIDTEMTKVLPDKVKEEILKLVPLSSMGQTSDVAEGVRFLASPASDYITGQVLVIDVPLQSGVQFVDTVQLEGLVLKLNQREL